MTIAVAEPTLEQLAEIANREHRLVLSALTDAFEHAVLCGQALNAALERVPRIERGKWLESNWDGTGSTAWRYRTIAQFRSELETAGVRSVYAAIDYLHESGIVAARGRGATAHIEEMTRMRREGMTPEEIGEHFAISPRRVLALATPGALERHRKAMRKSGARRRSARRALKRQEETALVKRAGGKVDEAYRLLRKTADVLQVASDDSRYSADVRRELASALRRLYGAEDAVVRASKLL